MEELEQRAACQLEIHSVSPAQIELHRNVSALSRSLQTADFSVLALSQTIKPDFVLTDDLSFRRVLEEQGNNVMGSVGLLLYAYKTDLLNQESLESAIERLFNGSTLYLSQQFKAYVQEFLASQMSE